MDHLAIWYRALHAERGVIVSTSNPDKFRQQMYALRRKTNDPQLSRLSIIITAKPGEVMVVKRTDAEEI